MGNKGIIYFTLKVLYIFFQGQQKEFCLTDKQTVFQISCMAGTFNDQCCFSDLSEI